MNKNMVLVSLSQLVWTIHNIYMVQSSNSDHRKKKCGLSVSFNERFLNHRGCTVVVLDIFVCWLDRVLLVLHLFW